MTIMNTELYEALVSAGAPDDKAKAAANVVEEQNKRFESSGRRFDKLDNTIETLRKDMEHGFDRTGNDIAALRKDTEHGFDRIERKIDGLELRLDGKIDSKFETLTTHFNMLKWAGGIGLALLVKIAFFSS